MIPTAIRTLPVLAALLGGLLLASAASAGGDSLFSGEIQPIEPSFAVEIDGVEAGYFKGVDGLSAEIEVVEDGDAGVATRAEVILRRPYVEGSELLRWFEESSQRGAVVSKALAVEVYAPTSAPVARWNFEHAWPAKWSVDVVTDRSGNTVAIEELVVAAEGLEIER